MGLRVGRNVGFAVVGVGSGLRVGTDVGAAEGDAVGAAKGTPVGATLGACAVCIYMRIQKQNIKNNQRQTHIYTNYVCLCHAVMHTWW